MLVTAVEFPTRNRFMCLPKPDQKYLSEMDKLYHKLAHVYIIW